MRFSKPNFNRFIERASSYAEKASLIGTVNLRQDGTYTSTINGTSLMNGTPLEKIDHFISILHKQEIGSFVQASERHPLAKRISYINQEENNRAIPLANEIEVETVSVADEILEIVQTELSSIHGLTANVSLSGYSNPLGIYLASSLISFDENFHMFNQLEWPDLDRQDLSADIFSPIYCSLARLYERVYSNQQPIVQMKISVRDENDPTYVLFSVIVSIYMSGASYHIPVKGFDYIPSDIFESLKTDLDHIVDQFNQSLNRISTLSEMSTRLNRNLFKSFYSTLFLSITNRYDGKVNPGYLSHESVTLFDSADPEFVVSYRMNGDSPVLGKGKLSVNRLLVLNEKMKDFTNNSYQRFFSELKEV